MTIKREVNLADWIFSETWGGAKDWIDELEWSEVKTLASNIEEIFGDEADETEINDFIWFDVDTWAEWLGYSDGEDLLESKKNIIVGGKQ